MVKRVFILCCTYYQLIVALQLKKTCLKDCDITVGLTDDSKGAAETAIRLEKAAVFHKIVFLEKKTVSSVTYYKKHRLQGILRAIWPSSYFQHLDMEPFDAFFFYNLDLYTYWVYAVLSKNNPKLRASLFEEGLVSYQNLPLYEKEDKTGAFSLIRQVRGLLHKPNLVDQIEGFYGFNQALYHEKWPFHLLPSIDQTDQRFVTKIRTIFDIQEPLSYPERFIYFANLLDTEGGGVEGGEVALAKAIADVVGTEQLLIKVHPRGDINEYLREGLKVDSHSSVPFEAIQLSMDFSQHIFLTTLSGAVLTISSIVDAPPAIIYLHKLYPKLNKQWGVAYDKILKSLREEGRIKNVFVPESLCALEEVLRSYLNRKGEDTTYEQAF